MQIECYLNKKYIEIVGYDKTKEMFLIRHVRFYSTQKSKQFVLRSYIFMSY